MKLTQPPLPPIEVGGEEERELNRVLEKRVRRGKVKWLVSWKGFGTEDNTWRPTRNLKYAEEVVKRFEERFSSAKKGKKRTRRKRFDFSSYMLLTLRIVEPY